MDPFFLETERLTGKKRNEKMLVIKRNLAN